MERALQLCSTGAGKQKGFSYRVSTVLFSLRRFRKINVNPEDLDVCDYIH